MPTLPLARASLLSLICKHRPQRALGALTASPTSRTPFPSTGEALDLKSGMFQALPHHGPAECPWANHITSLNLFPNL